MEFKQLEAFVAVVDYKSFSEAAKHLYLTQPTISSHIQALEKELNSRLLIRTTKQMKVTDRGMQLYECAVHMLNMRDQITDEFVGNKWKLIDVSASTIPSSYLLPELLSEFSKIQPDIHFHIWQSDSADAIEKVIQGAVDFGLTGSKTDAEDCCFIPFCTDSLVMAAPVTPEYLEQEIDSVFTDIRPDAVKIGMVSSAGLIKSIAKKLHEHKAENIVVDPVMVATSGSKLISDDAIGTLKEYLFPMAAVLTPNIPETEVLSGMEVKSAEDMIAAAKQISETYHCAVLCKGGHQLNDANDLLYRDGSYRWFNGKRIDNPNTHGTGCTLSSAIASNLAKGYDLDTAVERAKAYISGALAAMLDLGHGSGPMDHGFDFRGKGFAEEQA